MTDPNTTGTLSERAMLVHLKMSVWEGRKRDAEVTREVAERHQAKEGVGAYWKHLLPEDNKEHKATIHVQTMARLEHNELTLPWLNDGTRILLASNFFHYSERMRAHRDAFFAAAHNFFAVYPGMVQAAREPLNGLWKADDYPPVEVLQRRYRFDVQHFPFPSAADIRVDLGDENVQRIKDELAANLESVAAEAMQDAWKRLHTVLGRMLTKLEDPEGKYKDSLFGNVAELVDLLSHLNLTQDGRLTAMEQEIREKVLTCAPQTARDDKAERARVAREVARIQESVAACFEA